MLWVEKYRPNCFDEVTTHREVVEVLTKYTLETMPNLILHGQPGHNKRTLLSALISSLYGKRSNASKKTIELKINSQTIQINYLESEEAIEICPADYGTRDRHVVQHIIKEMAQTRPILGLFGGKARTIKIIVINRAEDLSQDAQAALRRTMEIYSRHFRMVMICTELSKLMEPIGSRALFIRVRGFTKQEIIDICSRIVSKEDYAVDSTLIEAIAENAAGDCKRAICLLELHCLNNDGGAAKKQKLDLASFKLDWEVRIENISSLIRSSPRPESFVAIRKEFYTLLVQCISPSLILVRLTHLLCKTSFEIAKDISKAALVYDGRMKAGSKPLLHLEAFAASAMMLLSQKSKR